MPCLCALFLSAMFAHAQTNNDVELLKRQLREATDNFERVIKEQRQVIDALSQRLDAVQKEQAVAGEKKKLEEQLAADLAKNTPPSAAAPPAAPATSWSPSQPITVARAGSAYMNISFDTLMDAGGSTAHDPSAQLQLGDHDPIKRGFSLRNAEIAVDGAVDPYFKGFGNIVLKLDKNNETAIELEEAYLMSTALPAQLLAAQPGERIADLCSAPGGKTAQLALAGAQVTAVERDPTRLARLRENFLRLHVTADIIEADATEYHPPAPFDAVLLDAPCSATGTIRRHPDVARLKRARDIPMLTAQQDRLLDAATAMLRPGGRLIYAVCSLQPEEGENRIAAALARLPLDKNPFTSRLKSTQPLAPAPHELSTTGGRSPIGTCGRRACSPFSSSTASPRRAS